MKKLILACVTLLLLATSCDGNKNEQKDTLETDLKNVINEHAKVADDFIGKLDELLTLEMAAAASGYPAAEAKKRPDSEAEKKINKINTIKPTQSPGYLSFAKDDYNFGVYYSLKTIN